MGEEQEPQQPQTHTHRYQIGYALEPKKIQNALGTSLFDYAKERGIDLIQIDLTRPLIQQGPFHCIIHKLQTKDWEQLQLEEYMAQSPHGVAVMDPPELVERLKNRVSMLDAVAKLKFSLENVTVGVPRQWLAGQKNTEETFLKKYDYANYNKDNLDHVSNRCGAWHNAVEEAMGLEDKISFPVIAKPFCVDGTASSHELCLIFDTEGLSTTLDANKENPIVLQEFVNHGGVVFKVYVAGEHVTCVKRKSLPNITEERAKNMKGAVNFSYISYFSGEGNNNNNVGNGGGGDEGGDDANLKNIIEKADMPLESFVKELGKGLREAMGINMFNVDVIRDAKDCNRYFVIDINHFPGYPKLPRYEPFVTDFLLDLVRNKMIADEVCEDGNGAI